MSYSSPLPLKAPLCIIASGIPQGAPSAFHSSFQIFTSDSDVGAFFSEFGPVAKAKLIGNNNTASCVVRFFGEEDADHLMERVSPRAIAKKILQILSDIVPRLSSREEERIDLMAQQIRVVRIDANSLNSPESSSGAVPLPPSSSSDLPVPDQAPYIQLQDNSGITTSYGPYCSVPIFSSLPSQECFHNSSSGPWAGDGYFMSRDSGRCEQQMEIFSGFQGSQYLDEGAWYHPHEQCPSSLSGPPQGTFFDSYQPLQEAQHPPFMMGAPQPGFTTLLTQAADRAEREASQTQEGSYSRLNPQLQAYHYSTSPAPLGPPPSFPEQGHPASSFGHQTNRSGSGVSGGSYGTSPGKKSRAPTHLTCSNVTCQICIAKRQKFADASVSSGFRTAPLREMAVEEDVSKLFPKASAKLRYASTAAQAPMNYKEEEEQDKENNRGEEGGMHSWTEAAQEEGAAEACIKANPKEQKSVSREVSPARPKKATEDSLHLKSAPAVMQSSLISPRSEKAVEAPPQPSEPVKEENESIQEPLMRTPSPPFVRRLRQTAPSSPEKTGEEPGREEGEQWVNYTQAEQYSRGVPVSSASFTSGVLMHRGAPVPLMARSIQGPGPSSGNTQLPQNMSYSSYHGASFFHGQDVGRGGYAAQGGGEASGVQGALVIPGRFVPTQGSRFQAGDIDMGGRLGQHFLNPGSAPPPSSGVAMSSAFHRARDPEFDPRSSYASCRSEEPLLSSELPTINEGNPGHASHRPGGGLYSRPLPSDPLALGVFSSYSGESWNLQGKEGGGARSVIGYEEIEGKRLRTYPLFVFHLPKSASDEDLLGLFAGYGDLHSVRAMPGMGYGFVNFYSYETACQAVHDMNGFPFEGRKLLVEFKKPSKNAAPVVPLAPTMSLRRGGGGDSSLGSAKPTSLLSLERSILK